MISLTKNNELKGYKSLDVYPEVAHFVTTRHEGISTGAYGSFNCSPYTNDSCMNVNRNQSWLFQCMNHQIKELFIPEQSHGCASLIINESFFKESLEMRRLLLRGMDALITNVPGYCVCVTTADCVSVLLYDKKTTRCGCRSCRMERNCEAYCQSCDGSLESEIRDARRRCGSLHRAEHFARII